MMSFLEFLKADSLMDITASKLCCDESIQRRYDKNVNLISENLVFSTGSIRYLKWLKKDWHQNLFESIKLTLATTKLSQIIAKDIGAEYQQNVLFVLNPHEYGTYFDFTLQVILLYDDNNKNILTVSEKSISQYATSILMKNHAYRIEKNIAGKIVYVITISNDICNKKPISNECIRQIQENALDIGYDYITDSRDVFDSYTIFYIQFEANYQKVEFNIADKLYHLSPQSNRSSILKDGLLPKSESFLNSIKLNHSDRVYLFNGLNIDAMSAFMKKCNKLSDKQLSGLSGFKDYFGEAFDIYEINRKSLNNLDLYKDNMFDSGIKDMPIALYTYNKIPPESIKLIKTLA